MGPTSQNAGYNAPHTQAASSECVVTARVCHCRRSLGEGCQLGRLRRQPLIERLQRPLPTLVETTRSEALADSLRLRTADLPAF